MSDEVGALVFDFGSHTLRAGFAGEDNPKVDIPSLTGAVPATDLKPFRRIIGHDILVPRERMELQPFLKDGLSMSFQLSNIRPTTTVVEDWDAFEDVVGWFLKYLTPEETSHHPILFSEPAWNTKNHRERTAEILFEKFKGAALTCFANGRHTGLVLDCGAIHTSAIPVYDGLVLTQEIIRSPLAGDFLVQQTQRLMDELKVDLVPYYRVAHKEQVNEREPPKWKERPNLPKTGASFENYMTKNLLQDFVASVLQVSDDRYDQSQADTFPMVGYEFPNGFNFELGHERFQIPEALFDPSILLEAGGNSMLSMSHIVASSISLCDIDIRPSLYSNVVVVGGTSLITGFTDRLQRDLNIKTPPSMRLKVNFPGTAAERRYSSWIGGSILGSLGTFQQMWVSSHEYNELGKGCVDKKCA
ncbi:SWI/SNF nucleosome remodeling complex component [Fasciola hepatica]|uniref:SWI/SNF nucleosome remodeling complex component n=1 Tax=Fasciola hepatica TaxID=6192 RepID=A0A4E0RL90_FASHE|nr:SWI/SNF nucleosome remodeling complex component [Fasciola hepatica]